MTSWHHPGHRRRHTALRWVRWAVAALTITDLVYFLSTRLLGGDPPGMWASAQTLVGYAVLLLALSAPLPAAWLGLLPLSAAVLTGPSGTAYPLLMVVLSMVWATYPSRAALPPTLCYAALIGTAPFAPAVPPAASALLLGFAVAGVLVGWSTRRVMTSVALSERQVSALERQHQDQERSEHAAFVSQLRGQIRNRLDQECRDASASAQSPDDEEVLFALLRSEAASRSILGQLRMLVTSLRAGPAAPSFGPTSIRETAEWAEDELVAHGYRTHLLVQQTDDLDEDVREALSGALRWGVPDLLEHAAAGARVEIQVVRTRRRVTLRLVEHRPQDSDVAHTAHPVGLERLVTAIRSVGGTITWTAADSWYLEVTVPVPDPVTVPSLPNRWAQRARWGGITVAALAAAPLLWAVLTASSPMQRPPAIGALAACLALVLGLISSRWVAPVGVAATLISLLSGSPWVIDLVLVAVWAGWIVLSRTRGWAIAAAVGASGYVAIRLTAHSIYLAVFAGILLLSTLLLLETLAHRRARAAVASALIAEQIEQVTQRVRHALAGELHDVVAHQLSRIVLTSEAVRDDDRVSRREALMSIAESLRATQAELDLLVEMLSHPDARAADGHALASVAAASLVETLEQHGYRPVAELDPALTGIDAPTQHLVVRILQECSTNILRYAPTGSPCRLSVESVPGAVRIRASSPLSPPTAPVRSVALLSSGFGLTGLGERVRAVGGSLHAGPQRQEWIVEALLPAP